MEIRWGSRLRRSIGLAAALVCGASACALPAPAGAASGIDLGFAEPRFNSSDPAVRSEWMNRAVDVGSQWARVGIGWAGIAPSPPVVPTDPGSLEYRWAGADAAVRDAAARGQQILITVSSAPGWAEGPGRDPAAEPGTWRPEPDAVRAFATALAVRYSGEFPDPLNAGATLPRVTAMEAWNEPNLSSFYAPQLAGGKPVSPDSYRQMLNAFYEGVHSVSPSAQVVGGALAPIGSDGGRKGKPRVGPLEFLRELLCLKEKGLKPVVCPVKAKFDVLSHHPINANRPPRAKAGADDAGIAEMGTIVKMLRKAESAGNVQPGGRRPVWNTEFWWHSNPPKTGRQIPSLKEQAAYISEALYLNWKDKVELAMLYQVGDDSSRPFQSGVFFEDGSAKQSRTAFQFPLVGDRKSRKKVLIWGRAPVAGTVAIQVKAGKRRFKTVSRRQVAAAEVFKTTTRLKGKGKLRAKLAGQKSLTWKQGKK